ncbi:isochorismatase family protein [Actinocorallia sp. A-T 12471]|uniref:isochorismatase family protein n=1 Tax=Actinocorallia sp. A-T 12471 TaxID=3089813 RepID=UPI0029CB20D1|nr:isochorismatase family protein [Actinocorallia sp. A-T 12471]MDX6740076.1 isochorismatase family protein [Actinocorallia sp. A-T 12471]
MGLPRIAPYSMPRELPPNRVEWRPDPSRAVLLVHDMQNYFVDAFQRDASPIPELIGNITLLREAANVVGVPVVFTAQPGAQTLDQRGLLQDFWGPGIPADPRSAAIIDELAPRPSDTRLTKWRYSAFQRTHLHRLMAEQGRDQLIVTGIYAHIGCLMTACEAFMSDIEAFFVADALADFTPAHHAQALQYAADRCAVTTTTAALAKSLTAPLPASR